MSLLLLLNDPQFRIPIATWTYDSLGQLRQINEFINVDDDIHQLITKYEYDVLGEKILERLPDPDGADTLGYLDTWYGYDKAGNLTAVTDPNAMLGSDPTTQQRHDAVVDNFHTVTTFYDGANRKVDQFDADPDGVATTEHDVPETTWGYDAVGNVKTQKDPAGNVVNYDYDELNRVTLEATNAYTTTLGTAQSVSRSYAYNDQGDVKKLTDRNGRVTEYSFDDLDRLKQEAWRDSAGGAVTRTFDYTYDDEGRRLTANDSDYPAAPNFVYDYYKTGWLKKISQTTQAGNNNVMTLSSTMSYYDDGSRKTLDMDAEGETLHNEYGYDLLGRMSDIAQFRGWGYTTDVHFDTNLLGNLTNVQRYQNRGDSTPVSTSEYQYDDAQRLKALTHHFDVSWHIYDLTRDAAGWVTDFQIDGASRSYSHDDNGQVTAAAGASYSYDLNGNRAMSGYVTGSDNRLARDGTYTYRYDNEGNRIARSAGPVIFNASTQTWDPGSGSADGAVVINYRYDQHNHLTRIMQRQYNGGTVSMPYEFGYRYDADDRRIAGDRYFYEQFIDSALYGYDGDDLTLLDPSADESPGAFFKLLVGPDGRPIASNAYDTEGAEWLLLDHEGTPRTLFVGSIDHSDADYDAWGKRTQSFSGNWASMQIGYAGGLVDTDAPTGLVHFGARDYDPGTGSFLQPDPGNERANARAYVGNDPIDYTDPTGWYREGHGSFVTDAIRPVFRTVGLVNSGSADANDLNLEYLEGLHGHTSIPFWPQTALFTPPSPVPGVFQTGWIYTGEGLWNGVESAYVGKANSLAERIFDGTDLSFEPPRHPQSAFLRAQSTEITARAVYTDPTRHQGDTRKEAWLRGQLSQEYAQIEEIGGIGGAGVLNQKQELSAQNQALYQRLYRASMGNPVTVKPAGEFMDRAAIGELDESLGSRLMLPRSSLGTVATGTSYAMLAFGVYSTVRQGMAVQRNQPIIVEGAMVFKDADGAFVVNEPTWMGRVFRNKPQKEYISGPLFDLLNHGEKKRQHIVVPLDNTEYEQLQKEHEERYQFDLDRLKLQRLMPGQAGVPIG